MVVGPKSQTIPHTNVVIFIIWSRLGFLTANVINRGTVYSLRTKTSHMVATGLKPMTSTYSILHYLCNTHIIWMKSTFQTPLPLYHHK